MRIRQSWVFAQLLKKGQVTLGVILGSPVVYQYVVLFVTKYAIQNDRIMALMGKNDGTCNSPSGMANVKYRKLYQLKALAVTLN
jgi:hypothetical protein